MQYDEYQNKCAGLALELEGEVSHLREKAELDGAQNEWMQASEDVRHGARKTRDLIALRERQIAGLKEARLIYDPDDVKFAFAHNDVIAGACLYGRTEVVGNADYS